MSKFIKWFNKGVSKLRSGNQAYSEGRLTRAIAFLNEAIDAFNVASRHAAHANEFQKVNVVIATCRMNLGNALDSTGAYSDAITNYRAAETLKLTVNAA